MCIRNVFTVEFGSAGSTDLANNPLFFHYIIMYFSLQAFSHSHNHTIISIQSTTSEPTQHKVALNITTTNYRHRHTHHLHYHHRHYHQQHFLIMIAAVVRLLVQWLSLSITNLEVRVTAYFICTDFDFRGDQGNAALVNR